MLKGIREFFDGRGLTEVMTPVLGRASVPDLHLDSLETSVSGEPKYLQTSPEYFMKRLLSLGVGPIYQLGPVFRSGEQGPNHRTEFLMLEWYQPDDALDALADEFCSLIAVLTEMLGREHQSARRVSYRKLFAAEFGINPHRATIGDLADLARASFPHAIQHLGDPDDEGTRNDYLDVLFSQGIEPSLDGLVLVFDYPASQCALARVGRCDGDMVARRFECYWDGLELANAYDELNDAIELRQRFEQQNQQRVVRGKRAMKIDEPFLAAVSEMPAGVGIAVGVDRLIQRLLGAGSLSEVLVFNEG